MLDVSAHPKLTGGFASLRRFAKKPAAMRECCELCGVEVPPDHDHLVEPPTRKILCACMPCGLLFSTRTETKYRRVPKEVYRLTGFEISDAEWDGLNIPIQMAFFFFSSPQQRMAGLYPSPAGPVEAELSDAAWQTIVADQSRLRDLQPDVEALLANRLSPRLGFEEREYYRAPIDVCYRLVGLLRMHWRGFSGGSDVWDQLRQFFDELRQRARLLREGT